MLRNNTRTQYGSFGGFVNALAGVSIISLIVLGYGSALGGFAGVA